MDRDRLGRRRRPGQNRGLRPLHPALPEEWRSEAIRVAMSAEDWSRFEALVREAEPGTPSRARAHGLALARLMDAADRPAAGPLDWLDYERQKALRLLRSAT